MFKNWLDQKTCTMYIIVFECFFSFEHVYALIHIIICALNMYLYIKTCSLFWILWFFRYTSDGCIKPCIIPEQVLIGVFLAGYIKFVNCVYKLSYVNLKFKKVVLMCYREAYQNSLFYSDLSFVHKVDCVLIL